jgi:hypothetical protein
MIMTSIIFTVKLYVSFQSTHLLTSECRGGGAGGYFYYFSIDIGRGRGVEGGGAIIMRGVNTQR